MSEINITRSEQEALKAIDPADLRRHVDQCLSDGFPYALQPFRLDSCGIFVVSKLREFERALAEHRLSKSPKKRADTRMDALRSGTDLLCAVEQMQARVGTEEKQAEFFYIDDHIQQPYSFTEQLSVRVHYRWRPSTDTAWAHESIEFSHKHSPRLEYQYPQPARKRSVAQQERDRQDELRSEWELLKRQALWSVREYFHGGGDGAVIPKLFQVKPDAHSRGLNNFSARFWH